MRPTRCQFFYWLSGEDSDPDHQFLGQMLHGTGKSKGFWVLKELELQSYPEEGTAPQRWVDWDPKTDLDTKCSTTTVSVVVRGVGLATEQQRCEKWDIEKGETAGDFANAGRALCAGATAPRRWPPRPRWPMATCPATDSSSTTTLAERGGRRAA